MPFRIPLLVILFVLACGSALGAGPRIGLEYEVEKDKRSGMRNDAVTVKPGWEFSSGGLLNLVELLIDRNRDAGPGSDARRDTETKLFLRLRHGGSIARDFAYYVRGGVGRSLNDDQPYSYAYIEPGLKYGFGDAWEWTLALRAIDAIDGTPGQRVNKLITGPSFTLDRHSEIELRYIVGKGDKDLRSWQLGYLYRF
jgi:hypothetical protein